MNEQKREQLWREACARHSRPLYAVALQSGVSISTVYLWRRYGITPKRPQTRAKLAELLGIPISQLEGTNAEHE